MPYGLYLSAAGADVQNRRLEVLANNLANVDTAGFKRELAVIQARHSEAIERGETFPGRGTIDDIGGGVLIHETLTSFSPGILKFTGVSTDMAIDGEGFFVIRKGDQQLLTRAGNFQLSPDGRLVTQDGYDVLSSEGETMVFSAVGPRPQVSSDGSIQQGGAGYQLMLVRPQSSSDLVKTGENRYRTLAEPQRLPPSERSIRGGYLEQSNVSPVQGMMELMEATRAYEANVRLMQNQDQMMGALLNRVLRS